MTTLAILRQARALIDTPEKWSNIGYYDDRGGGKVCALQALRNAGGYQWDNPRVLAAATALARAAGLDGDADWYDVGEWNDNHAHADVMAAFDRAIAAEEAKA